MRLLIRASSDVRWSTLADNPESSFLERFLGMDEVPPVAERLEPPLWPAGNCVDWSSFAHPSARSTAAKRSDLSDRGMMLQLMQAFSDSPSLR